MSDFTGIIEGPTEQVVTRVPETTQDKPLSVCVKNALENYFSQLEGEHPMNLYNMVLEQMEMPMLEIVMRVTGNNQSRAAKLLGISRGTLRKKLKIYDLL